MRVVLLETEIDPETVAIRRRNLLKSMSRNRFMHTAADDLAKRHIDTHGHDKTSSAILKKSSKFRLKANHANLLVALLDARKKRGKLGNSKKSKTFYTDPYDVNSANVRSLRTTLRDLANRKKGKSPDY